MTGWLHCLGRHTVTGVVVAAGAVGTRHISVFHRFFSRAVWSFNALGHVVFILALRWIPADQPLHFLGDDTLARKHGKCISLASMHHDPLLSTARKPFCSFGHLWVVLALWVPLSVGPLQGIALPFQVGLYVGTKRGGQTNAAGRPSTGKRHRAAQAAAAKVEHRTKLELLRELVGTAAAWAGDRTCYLVVDSAYAGRTLLEQRPPNVHVISRLRLDAALWTPPPPAGPANAAAPAAAATASRHRRSWPPGAVAGIASASRSPAGGCPSTCSAPPPSGTLPSATSRSGSSSSRTRPVGAASMPSSAPTSPSAPRRS